MDVEKSTWFIIFVEFTDLLLQITCPGRPRGIGDEWTERIKCDGTSVKGRGGQGQWCDTNKNRLVSMAGQARRKNRRTMWDVMWMMINR